MRYTVSEKNLERLRKFLRSRRSGFFDWLGDTSSKYTVDDALDELLTVAGF
jgi:hypothetical protein